MKSQPLPEKRRPPRAADSAVRTAKHQPAAFHPRVANGLARDGDSRQSYRSDHDPEYRTDDTSEGISMKAAIGSSALARIFLVAGFGVALSAMPANAQKAGGSITVGLELEIPGFDPLKVGVYDTSAETAAAAIFDTLVALDDNG